MRGYEFSKLYADLVTEEGAVCIFYLVWVRLLGRTYPQAGVEVYLLVLASMQNPRTQIPASSRVNIWNVQLSSYHWSVGNHSLRCPLLRLWLAESRVA